MQRRYRAVILSATIMVSFAASLISVNTGSAQAFMCAQDLNNDGDVAQQGETADCVTTPQGQLCPISAVTCTTSQMCPFGSQYACNKGTCSSGVCSSVTATTTVNSITKYQCDLTGTNYDTQVDCTADCGQTASCQNTYICPLGPQYPCMDNGGMQQCSPNTCYDISTGTTTTTSDTSGYTNNGTIDPDTGSCLGQLYFFNGKGSECRPSGVNTTFFDCCNTGDGGLLGFLKYCKQTEADTVTALNAKRCHAVGDYCVTKWALLGCVQRARVSCCFNSMLGRIIQEQGRPQLHKFAPNGQWGSPTAPNCVGFKPEEFQMLDFSKMDLSEFTNTINATVSMQIQQKMNDSVNKFFNNTQ